MIFALLQDTGQPAVARLPVHEIAKCLRSRRRVDLIRYVHEHGESRLADIADRITEREIRLEPNDKPWSKRRKTVYVTMYQYHMPQLQDWGVLEWDQPRGDVWPGPNLGGIVAALSDIEKRSAD